MSKSRLKHLACVVCLALLAGVGPAAAAGSSSGSGTTQGMYCPAGSGLVCWIFGCWCEDAGLNRVAPARCSSLPPMQEGSWNSEVDTVQACATPTSATTGQKKNP